MTLLESVPNVSEGRDPGVIESIAQALRQRGRVLDIHSDADHHRSVFTVVAGADDLVGALLEGIARAAELIDLRHHDGIHPRIGASDVVPIVPIGDSGMELARDVALTLGQRVGAELGLPVFLYGTSGGGKRPAFFRHGGPAELQRRIDTGEVRPAFGPARLDPRAGGVLIGARPLLIAFNIDLSTGDLEDANAIALAVRESGGGMPGVQALGLLLRDSGRVQVSLNVIDVSAAPLVEVVGRVRDLAALRGVEVGPSELVGLIPEAAVAPAAALGLPDLPDAKVLERRLYPGSPSTEGTAGE
ncbi:glutamate formimidoyltransferase [Gaiella sp.]|uniref:glutamate formimidoyltransferase n=1 Tax=Gaiella sp. TaxID=2663207 RepID=UPI00326397A4